MVELALPIDVVVLSLKIVGQLPYSLPIFCWVQLLSSGQWPLDPSGYGHVSAIQLTLSFVELDLGVQVESPQLTLKKLCINNGSIHNKVTNFT